MALWNPDNPQAMLDYVAEAEQFLLGALLLDNAAYDRVVERVAPADCYCEAHRLIFAKIAALLEAGQSADILSVFEAMQRDGTAGAAGGLAYLGELANVIPTTQPIVRYADVVRERARLRTLVAALRNAEELARAANGLSVEERIERCVAAVTAVADAHLAASGAEVGSGDCAMVAWAGIEAARSGTQRRYATGLAALDALLCDLVPGALAVVAARPGMGKSALALQIAQHVADAGAPGAVALFSLEMSREQIGLRVIAHATGIDVKRLADGVSLSAAEQGAVCAAIGRINNTRLVVDDSAALTVGQLRMRCNAIRRRSGGLRLVVVDYLQLLRSKGENRTQEVGAISRGLKALAKDFGVPVIALSQMNRAAETRPGRRPQLSDLRESGDIEQDADIIIFVHREGYYTPQAANPDLAELIVAKQRNGPTGQAQVRWHAAVARFEDGTGAAFAAARTTPRVRQGGLGAGAAPRSTELARSDA